jgi:hypothetical protein
MIIGLGASATQRFRADLAETRPVKIWETNEGRLEASLKVA